jgi:hypothetical protein
VPVLSSERAPELLRGEIDVFVHSAPDPVTQINVISRITNWALRVTYPASVRHLDSCIIPLAAIFAIAKTGGKKRTGWYGVTLELATSSCFCIPCSREHNDRPGLIGTLDGGIQSPLKFPESVWLCPLDWCNSLALFSGWEVFHNDVSPTYPPRFLIPPGIPRALDHNCARYRTRHCIPFLSYVSPSNRAPLIRAAQPKTGLTNAPSPADQEFLSAVCNGRWLSILDCRPKLNARVNQFTGGGYERSGTYRDCSVEFLGIPNIHRVRDAYQESGRSSALGLSDAAADPRRDRRRRAPPRE